MQMRLYGNLFQNIPLKTNEKECAQNNEEKCAQVNRLTRRAQHFATLSFRKTSCGSANPLAEIDFILHIISHIVCDLKKITNKNDKNEQKTLPIKIE